MKTLVECSRDGEVLRIFHRQDKSDKSVVWTHPPGAECEVCDGSDTRSYRVSQEKAERRAKLRLKAEGLIA